MNFGIIGFGKIARKFASSITHTTEGRVYAIGSKSLDVNDTYVKENPDVKIYKDYDLLLEDTSVDAVYIALPHAMHKEWIIKALKKHIPVLCEKPAVLSTEDMKEVQAVAKETNTYFLEAFKTKFNIGMNQLKQDVSKIGKIGSIEANFCFDALPSKDDGSYLFDPLQGGALNDVGTYVIGFVLSIAEGCIEKVDSHVEVVDNIERYFHATWLYNNGIKATVEGAIDRNKERYAIIKGEFGSIHIPIFNRIINYTIRLNDTILERNTPITGDDMTLEIQALIDDVNHHKNYSTIHSLEDTYKIIEVIERIRENT